MLPNAIDRGGRIISCVRKLASQYRFIRERFGRCAVGSALWWYVGLSGLDDILVKNRPRRCVFQRILIVNVVARNAYGRPG